MTSPTSEKARAARAALQVANGALANPEALLLDAAVETLTGLGSETRRQLIQQGKFPAPERLGPRLVRWRASGVASWLRDPQSWMAGLGTVTVTKEG